MKTKAKIKGSVVLKATDRALQELDSVNFLVKRFKVFDRNLFDVNALQSGIRIAHTKDTHSRSALKSSMK